MGKIPKTAVVFPFIAFFLSAAGGIHAQCVLRDTVVLFRHFEYQVADDYSLAAWNPNNIITTSVPGYVMENELIKVVAVPEFGGRVLSMVYKPTGHESFYQNPVGTVFGDGQDWFFYRWLMVWGGVFPTFPEPEHGKTWFLPWEHAFTEQGPDKISLRMEFTDNINFGRAGPKFNNGQTDITCVAVFSITRGSAALELDVQLINNRDQDVNYEYWTCITYAPGSVPGEPASPGNSEIVAPVSKLKVKRDNYPWMANMDPHIDGDPQDVFPFNKLATFSNWQSSGIAYAWPELADTWHGVINHENEEGLLSISDRELEAVNSLKLWTWGYEQAMAADPEKSDNEARPYIELWRGHSSEFFDDAVLPAGITRSWKESFYPTVGLSGVTAANRLAAVQITGIDQMPEGRLYTGLVSTVCPGARVPIRLQNYEGTVILDTVIIQADGAAPLEIQWYGPDGFSTEDKLLLETVGVIPVEGGNTPGNKLSFQVRNGMLRVMNGSGYSLLKMTDINGRVLAESRHTARPLVFPISQGVFILHAMSPGRQETRIFSSMR